MPSPDRLSLGWRSELIFPGFDAEVVERRGYLLVRTPHNPTYWWGNYLLFDHPPEAGDAAAWVAAFQAEIGGRQCESRHLAFGIDTPADTLPLPADFAALGVRAYRSIVLTMRADQLRPPRRDIGDGYRIRPLRLPDEAGAAAELQVAADQGGHEPAGYRVFRQRQMLRYSSMARAGMGHWFGVFADAGGTGREDLVADCGLFRDGDGPQALGRFQHVSTHPAWRRRGLCSALIRAVCRHGFDAMGVASLVILADPDDVAIGLYEALGFRRHGHTWHLERRPPP